MKPAKNNIPAKSEEESEEENDDEEEWNKFKYLQQCFAREDGY